VKSAQWADGGDGDGGDPPIGEDMPLRSRRRLAGRQESQEKDLMERTLSADVSSVSRSHSKTVGTGSDGTPANLMPSVPHTCHHPSASLYPVHVFSICTGGATSFGFLLACIFFLS